MKAPKHEPTVSRAGSTNRAALCPNLLVPVLLKNYSSFTTNLLESCMSSRYPNMIPKLSLLSVGILGLLTACTSPDLPPITPPTNNSIDLSSALGVTELAVIGVTIDATTGQRYVLDANAGIFEILEDGTADLVRSNQGFPIPDVAPVSAWTDFVALGDDQFAVTARNDGYLLDLDDDLSLIHI